MQFDLMHIWQEMGFLNRLISVSLVVMGLAVLTVFFERTFALLRSRARARAFSLEATEHLEAGRFGDVLRLAEDAPSNHLTQLLASTLKAYFADIEGKLSPLERARNEVVRYLESFGKQLRRGLPAIATVGSVAPFVGLLGTVIGIIVAFQGIAATGGGGLSAVAGGISEALVETALGLLIAIPAVMLFNFLSTRMDQFEHEIEQAASRLLELLEDRGRRADADQRAA